MAVFIPPTVAIRSGDRLLRFLVGYFDEYEPIARRMGILGRHSCLPCKALWRFCSSRVLNLVEPAHCKRRGQMSQGRRNGVEETPACCI